MRVYNMCTPPAQLQFNPFCAILYTHHHHHHQGFDGAFGQNHVSPRGLSSRKLAQLVCVEGIVTKCSLVRPKVVRRCVGKAGWFV